MVKKKQNKEENKYYINCFFCNYLCSYTYDHREDDAIKCNECSKFFSTSNKLLHCKCPYCNELLPYNDKKTHMDNCNPNWNEINGTLYCYSCGKLNTDKNLFTSSQLNKEHLARCKECVTNNNYNKYVKYKYTISASYINNTNLFYDNKMLKLNKELYSYASDFNYEKVLELLQQGANPNYVRQADIIEWIEYTDICDKKYICPVGFYLYDENGNEISEKASYQPTTAFRSCIFSLSSVYCNFNNIYKTAKLLLEFGADKEDALMYLDHLYYCKTYAKEFFEFYNEDTEVRKIYNLLV